MNLFAKKSLGQNFLNSPEIVTTIVEAGNITSNDIVLEVGPGKGVLTAALLQRVTETGGKVIAVEKDDRMIPYLQEMFKKELENGQLKLIHADILEVDLAKNALEQGKYIVAANIPYYITGQFLKKFLEYGPQPKNMVIMVQKEVAERIVAKDGKESILSISVKVFGEPIYVQTVKAGNFNPVPNVDSAILAIKNIQKPNLHKDFFTILHAGFAHKRKFLARNLEDALPREKIEEFWQTNSLDAKIRAEDVAPSFWIDLSNFFSTEK